MSATGLPNMPKVDPSPSTSLAPELRKSWSRITDAAKNFVFTKDRLEKLPVPTTRTYYRDGKQPGLILTIFPSGKKSFYLYYWEKENSKPERHLIGPYPGLTIEQARDRAKVLTGQIANGENPADERRLLAAEGTFANLFASYLEKHAKVKKRTWAEDERQFNCYLREFAQLKLSAITRTHIVRLHEDISVRAPYAANRVLSLIRKVFNWTSERGDWKGSNPAAKLPRNKETKRARFLDTDELPAFWRALADEENETLRDFFLTCLLTGGRSRSNVATMQWSEIRWQRAIWHIPGEKFKNGEPQDVQLVPFMMSLLRARREREDADSVWVFPGDGKTGHLVESKTGWARVLRRAGIRNLRVHDLRRSMASWMAINGTSLNIIGKSLGHASLEATAIYARLNADPVRASVERAVNSMLDQVPDDVKLLPASGEGQA